MDVENKEIGNHTRMIIMKICFLAGASSVHTVRWVNAMVARGHEVDLITMHQDELNQIDHQVTVHTLQIPAPFGYYLNSFKAKKIIEILQPDVLHVHYASGYATLARRIDFQPTVLSVWGSDVYLFPYQSKWNKRLLRKNLAYADKITATGTALRQQTELFVNHEKDIDVIAFGINMALFKPNDQNNASNDIYIGTVKKLKDIYGIDILLQAVALLIDKLKSKEQHDIAASIKVMIVGSGPDLENLQQLANDLHISEKVEFIPDVANESVPYYLDKLDIYCAFSRSESFGVAVLEASACGLPVVTSDVGGLPEVVDDNESGYITNIHDIPKIVEKLYSLVMDPAKRTAMGKAGREFVQNNYDWDQNVTEMEQVYQSVILAPEK